MAEITDPAILAQLSGGTTGGDAKSGLTRNEMGTRESSQSEAQNLKQFLRMTMEAEAYNRRLPTGRFNAKVNEIGQSFPDSWKSNNIADYQSFMGLRQRMVKPSMGILTGSTPRSGEMNTPAEVTMQMSAIPGPEKEFGANRYLGDTAGKAAQMRLARNSWQENWRNRYGSTHTPDKRGLTMDAAFDEYITKGAGAKWANKPMSAYYQEQVDKRARQKPPAGDAFPDDIAAILKLYKGK